MPDKFTDLVPLLSSSGLAAVNVYLLFKVLAILERLSETQAVMVELLR